jgi:hypothetical protein
MNEELVQHHENQLNLWLHLSFVHKISLNDLSYNLVAKTPGDMLKPNGADNFMASAHGKSAVLQFLVSAPQQSS